jgi:hypothetical protein
VNASPLSIFPFNSSRETVSIIIPSLQPLP